MIDEYSEHDKYAKQQHKDHGSDNLKWPNTLERWLNARWMHAHTIEMSRALSKCYLMMNEQDFMQDDERNIKTRSKNYLDIKTNLTECYKHELDAITII